MKLISIIFFVVSVFESNACFININEVRNVFERAFERAVFASNNWIRKIVPVTEKPYVMKTYPDFKKTMTESTNTTIEDGIFYYNASLGFRRVGSSDECNYICMKTVNCKFWSLRKNYTLCHLRGRESTPVKHADFISGVMNFEGITETPIEEKPKEEKATGAKTKTNATILTNTTTQTNATTETNETTQTNATTETKETTQTNETTETNRTTSAAAKSKEATAAAAKSKEATSAAAKSKEATSAAAKSKEATAAAAKSKEATAAAYKPANKLKELIEKSLKEKPATAANQGTIVSSSFSYPLNIGSAIAVLFVVLGA